MNMKRLVFTVSVVLMASGPVFASDRIALASGEQTPARSTRVVQQFERMVDSATDKRLYYSVGEVAGLAELPEERILRSIEERKLCVIVVDGVALVPAQFLDRYLERMTLDRAEADQAIRAAAADQSAALAASASNR